MRYYLDTEFIERGGTSPLILLSIAIVAEDGRELYLEWEDAPVGLANRWVQDNVLPSLGKSNAATSWQGLHLAVMAFFRNDPAPEFWGYYADYDWVLFCQIFGTMLDLPKTFPLYCNDLKQWAVQLGDPELPKQESTEHHALHDARWNREVWEFLNAIG